MELFKKKFKVRVSLFSESKYTVDYAYYRFIPNWKSLVFWYGVSFDSNIDGWSTDLFSVKEAEEIANRLKSIDDVERYYKPEDRKREKFLIEKEEYLAKNRPYKTKNIL